MTGNSLSSRLAPRRLFRLADSPLQKVEDLAGAHGKTLLVVLGDLKVLDQVPGGLSGFLDKGGAVWHSPCE